jgi:thiol:disulfide interchange protein DsbD
MGMLSALIVGPCVAAPLAGALVYISQTRDVVVGGVALFCLSAGMSVPLLMVGLSAGSLLPRAGRWMDAVKHAMGLALLAVAWWMVLPVAPTAIAMLLLAAWFALAAALLGAFHPLATTDGLARAVPKAAGVLCLFVAVAQVAGALSGARDPMQPLRGLVSPAIGDASAAAPRASAFRTVETQSEILAGLGDAGARPVLLDFYADWCTSCKELEHRTFADPRVQERLRNMALMRVDVTRNEQGQREILQRYGLFGPPAVLVFADQRERARVIGFQDAERFLETLDRAGSR